MIVVVKGSIEEERKKLAWLRIMKREGDASHVI